MAALQRYDSMLFNYKTSYLTDYKVNSLKTLDKTVYKPKKERLRAPYERLKSQETLCNWKGLPFDLWIKPNAIVRGNPKIVQEAYTEPPDLEREEVQMTRPRIFMTPAVAIDNTTPAKRQIIVNDVYISTTKRAQKEGATAFKQAVKAPFADYPAPPKPISLPLTATPVVSPEWRMESAAWDGKQIRSYCDPHKEFWTRRKAPFCSTCDQTAVYEDQKKHKAMKNPPVYIKLGR